MQTRCRFYVLLLSFALYGLALVSPAHQLADRTQLGWTCLAYGWASGVPGMVAWSANLMALLMLL